jgi:hypothetical protein
MTQFSLFGAEAAAPDLADLDGLLLAGGHWVRSQAGARLSVVVAERWRAEAVAAAFVTLGVDGPESIVASPSGFGVRSGFAEPLREHAARWTRGANEGVPAGFQLGPGGLRLWAIAAGHRDEVGYLLATVEPDNPMHHVAGAQLSRLGVAAVSLARGGPGWRVTSSRRLRRLVELVGPPPPGGSDDWPVTISSV